MQEKDLEKFERYFREMKYFDKDFFYSKINRGEKFIDFANDYRKLKSLEDLPENKVSSFILNGFFKNVNPNDNFYISEDFNIFPNYCYYDNGKIKYSQQREGIFDKCFFKEGNFDLYLQYEEGILNYFVNRVIFSEGNYFFGIIQNLEENIVFLNYQNNDIFSSLEFELEDEELKAYFELTKCYVLKEGIFSDLRPFGNLESIKELNTLDRFVNFFKNQRGDFFAYNNIGEFKVYNSKFEDLVDYMFPSFFQGISAN